ncbi:MAG: hypothetical protein JW390_60038 [Nitrosopumilus sp.]|nr:hypothetical protein [Candidatus Nitrosopumilus limneticus]
MTLRMTTAVLILIQTCSSDSDSDDIRDTIDMCKFEKETYNGFLDADGCPDNRSTQLFTNNMIMVDRDLDGILDKLDKCISLPETYNNSKMRWLS